MLGFVGNYAPIAGYILSAFALRNRGVFLFFLFGFINDILNRILKRWIRDPRPSLFHHDESAGKFDTLTFIAGKWGMPSGHAQHIFYCIGYLLYSGHTVIHRIDIIPIMLLLSMLTLFQRWFYHYHTILQLIVGSIVGFLFGIFSNHIIQKYT